MVVRSHAGLAGGAGWLEEQFDGGVSQEKLGAPAGGLASSPTLLTCWWSLTHHTTSLSLIFSFVGWD